MTKPVSLPEWDDTQVNTIEPDQDHKDEGWLAPDGVPEKPPFQTFNWWMNNVYLWIKEGDDRGLFNGVVAQTGGGALTPYRVNELQDGSTYQLPAADSLEADESVIVSVIDTYSENTPTVERDGTDTITDVNGPDTEFIFDALTAMEVRFTTDGISDWRI